MKMPQNQGGGCELPTLWNRCAGAHTAPLRSCIRNLAQFDSLCLMAVTIKQNMLVFTVQGRKLRLTGCQCHNMYKCSVDNQNFKTGHQQVTILLFPRHLKLQGKRALLKRKHKAWKIVVKQSNNFTILIFTCIYPLPYCFSHLSQYGYCG